MASAIPDYLNKINTLLPGAEIVIRSKPLDETQTTVYIEGLKKLFPGLNDKEISREKIGDKTVVAVKDSEIQRISKPATGHISSLAQQVKGGEQTEKEQKSEASQASKASQAPPTRKTFSGEIIPNGFVVIEGAPTDEIDPSILVQKQDLAADQANKVDNWLPLFQDKKEDSLTHQILRAHAFPQNILKMGNVNTQSNVVAIYGHKDHPDEYVFEIRPGTFVFRAPGFVPAKGKTYLLLTEKEIESFLKKAGKG